MPSSYAPSPQKYAGLIRDEPQAARIEALIQEFLVEVGHISASRVELANAYFAIAGHDRTHDLILGAN